MLLGALFELGCESLRAQDIFQAGGSDDLAGAVALRLAAALIHAPAVALFVNCTAGLHRRGPRLCARGARILMPVAWAGSVFLGLVLEAILSGIPHLRLRLFVPSVSEASWES